MKIRGSDIHSDAAFFSGPENVKWLTEAHLKGVRFGHAPKAFRSFVLWGNKDAPRAVDLYAKADPDINDAFVRIAFAAKSEKVQVHMVDRYKRNVPTREIGDKVHNWWSADTFLGRRNQRKLANNTVIYRDPIEPDAIRVKLHYTVIVTYFRDGRIQINSGGHHTKTTKQRLNQLLPHGVGIHQKNFDWYVSAGDSTVPFRDGMILTPFGEQWTPAGQRYAINPHSSHKYDSDVTEWLDVLSSEGGWLTDQQGSVEYGGSWYGLMESVDSEALVRAAESVGDDEHSVGKAYRTTLRGVADRDGAFDAIIEVNSDGFVGSELYPIGKGDKAWQKLLAEVGDSDEDEPEGYDELDEPEHEDLT